MQEDPDEGTSMSLSLQIPRLGSTLVLGYGSRATKGATGSSESDRKKRALTGTMKAHKTDSCDSDRMWSTLLSSSASKPSRNLAGRHPDKSRGSKDPNSSSATPAHLQH